MGSNGEISGDKGSARFPDPLEVDLVFRTEKLMVAEVKEILNFLRGAYVVHIPQGLPQKGVYSRCGLSFFKAVFETCFGPSTQGAGTDIKTHLHTPKAVAYHESHYCRCMIGHSLGRMDHNCRFMIGHRLGRMDHYCRFMIDHSLGRMNHYCRFMIGHSLDTGCGLCATSASSREVITW